MGYDFNISEAIKHIYPHLDNARDFQVAYNEEDGFTLRAWNTDLPVPTEEELQAAWLGALRKQKIDELGVACQAAINSTFVSSALGTPHVYSYDAEARENLKNAEAAAKYMADDATVEWRIHDTREVKRHTKQQVIQLFLDSVQHVQTNVAKYRQLEAQVLAATTEEEITAIKWEVTDGTTTV
jgi:hypothetical protein